MVLVTLASAALAVGLASAHPEPNPSVQATTTYHQTMIDGVKVFYREAGPKDAPTILLLHGYPSSSAQFATLIPLLADRYHLIAPDYPGFGQSDAPSPHAYAYTFDHLAQTMEKLIETLGLKSYVLYMNDYGGPVGFRLAMAHPERVLAMIAQNANASEDGLGPLWDPRKAYWRDRAGLEEKVINAFTSLAVTRDRHVGKSPRPERYNPADWLSEFAHLSQPGQREIQSDLFYDYRTNVAAYPEWQAWMRERQPPMLVVWGKYDPSFAVGGAFAYGRDIKEAEIHILNAGHFGTDEAVDEIAALVRRFLATRDLSKR